jgi:DNA end-binding protein Ku
MKIMAESEEKRHRDHAIWKGAISFGLVQIPVGLYSAESAKELHFNLLDKRDLSPVSFERHNKTTGKPVAWNQIVKGYQYEKGEYVLLSEEDFKKANVEATETVDIMEFVETQSIDPVYFDKPYYLAPLKGGNKAYALLREALQRSGRVGIAKVVLRTRQHLGALMVRGPVLVLNLLRFGHEIRAYGDLALPPVGLKAAGISEKELDMANRLIDSLQGEWDPDKYRDDYYDDLLTLIERKWKAGHGQQISAESEAKPRHVRGDVIDIMELLKRSVAGANADDDADEAGHVKPKRAGTKKAGGARRRSHAG